MKPLQDYQKIRRAIGWFLRNRKFQSMRLAPHEYLQIGCGPQLAPGFINLDYRWVPGIDVVWDLARPLPFPADRFRGIFSEHCLEHFPEVELAKILAEMHRVLRPGGRVRIVVPSLEIHVRRYLTACTDTDEEPAQVINRVFYSGHDWMQSSRWLNDGHHFIHDYASMAARLHAAGFEGVARVTHGAGNDPRLLIDRADRAWESLYMEASKPATTA